MKQYGFRRSCWSSSSRIWCRFLYYMVNYSVLIKINRIIFKSFLLFRLFLIYLKWFHEIQVKFSSIGLGGIHNLDINHRLFHLRIKTINILSPLSIFIWRLSINDIQLKINSITNKTLNNNKQKKDWKTKLYLLKVRIFRKLNNKKNLHFQYVSIQIEQLQIEYQNTNITFRRISLHPPGIPNITRYVIFHQF